MTRQDARLFTWQETNFASTPGTWAQVETFPRIEVCSENNQEKIVKLPRGYSVGMQVVSRELFLDWCKKAISLGNISIKRLDELPGHFQLPPQVTLIPKVELCRHFDAYYHTTLRWSLMFANLPANIVPPLLFQRVFERDINIRVGYETYKARLGKY